MMEVTTAEKPEERRDLPRGHLEVVHLTGLDFTRGMAAEYAKVERG